MSDIAKVTDHWTETVSDFILEQYKDASNWKAILKAVIDKYSDLEDQIWKLAPILDFKCRVKGEIPTGALLDFIAGIMNVTRNGGESDRDFYERFVTSLDDDSAGTPDDVIYNAAILSGDTAPQYMDEADCTFFVYTGPRGSGQYSEELEDEEGDVLLDEDGEALLSETDNDEISGGGDQLYASQAKKLAPAGVLGLVGACIQYQDSVENDAAGDEEVLCDTEGNIILAVADDSTVERETVLVDNGGNLMVTSQQKVVKVSLKGDSRYQTTPIHVDGVPGTIDGIRVKDLPDAQNDEGFFVRDSEAGGTVKSKKIDAATVDEIWNEIENGDNG